jgi:molybdopterin molybdotransferase
MMIIHHVNSRLHPKYFENVSLKGDIMLLSYEQALDEVINRTHPLPAEEIPAENAVGRVLAEDIISALDQPPFHKSAMDGYAFRFGASLPSPLQLRCAGTVGAGESFPGVLKNNECVKIMTGSPLPEGADTVVMVENTSAGGDLIRITKQVHKGENVCIKGEDIRRGQKVLEKDRVIHAPDVALLATVGTAMIRVTGLPKAAVLNTGKEIVTPGNPLKQNQIYNSNGPLLACLLKRDHIAPDSLGIVEDDEEKLFRAIHDGLEYNILLISGGVSMGDFDLIPHVLGRLGVQKVFHKVNIKPGKPVYFGTKGKTYVFGIPGNPVSNFVCYFLFVQPAIRKLMGYKNCRPKFLAGTITADYTNSSERTHFVPVRIRSGSGCFFLTPVESHGSADTYSLSLADGFMTVLADAVYAKGQTGIPFFTWKNITGDTKNCI